MTQEEIYIKLIQGRRVPPEEISKEFLRDFQFCRAALEKIGIGLFSEEQQREMNLQAVEFYFLSSKRIFLEYDIPEIARLVPENISGSLELWQSKVKELPQLKNVGGGLNLWKSQIRELPQLESVEGKIWANRSNFQYWKDYFTKTNRPHLTKKVTH
jgi:hypothetical protein